MDIDVRQDSMDFIKVNLAILAGVATAFQLQADIHEVYAIAGGLCLGAATIHFMMTFIPELQTENRISKVQMGSQVILSISGLYYIAYSFLRPVLIREPVFMYPFPFSEIHIFSLSFPEILGLMFPPVLIVSVTIFGIYDERFKPNSEYIKEKLATFTILITFITLGVLVGG